MARSARPVEDEDEIYGSPVRQALAGFGAVIARYPAIAGGSTAFLVALSFVSANALWYQPHFHGSAFFVTREPGGPVIVEPAADAERAPERRVASDPQLAKVQSRLSAMGYYDGEVDGLSGPATRKAIGAFQQAKGMPETGLADARLLDSLGIERPGTVARSHDPVPQERPDDAAIVTASAEPDDIARIKRVQAGLRAFGNNGIDIDGVVGSRTRSAIKEFQTLFGLPVTGEPDERLYAKMREIGLTN